MRLFSRRPRPAKASAGSYGKPAGAVQTLSRAIVAAVCLIVAVASAPAWAEERPVRIVALGDSLTAGAGLAGEDAFPAKLERALRAKGIAVTIENAGVSGDTATGGLARLDWSVPDGTEAVIVELGANDMLRGGNPKHVRTSLEAIVKRLKQRRITVLLAGMLAAPNLGLDYTKAFDSIYPDLAAAYDAVLYPFFLEGVVTDQTLLQRDGLHPTAAGVDVIVSGILPKAEELVARVRAARGS